eukprot:scaffold5874_cov140-Isochrysis_galbana.AAC.5
MALSPGRHPPLALWYGPPAGCHPLARPLRHCRLPRRARGSGVGGLSRDERGVPGRRSGVVPKGGGVGGIGVGWLGHSECGARDRRGGAISKGLRRWWHIIQRGPNNVGHLIQALSDGRTVAALWFGGARPSGALQI